MERAKASLFRKLAAFARPVSTPAFDVVGTFNQGVERHQAGHFNEAENIYQRVLEAQPNHFGSLYLLGVLASQRGNHAAAVVQIDTALKIRPNVPEAFNNRGIALQGLGRLDEALASYAQAIGLKPSYTEAFYNRAGVFQELKRLDEALASYDQAIALKPGYAEAFNNRGVALRELKRVDEALASFNQAIALKPDYVEAFHNRGTALREMKRPDEALASYDQVIALSLRNAEAFYNRGSALAELKRLDEAVASFSQAIAFKPDYAEAFNNRGTALQELKRLDEAVASYDQAIRFKPGYAEAYNNRGVALRDLDRVDEALASYDQAIRLKPDYAEAFTNRGIALQDQARLDDALTCYRKAVELEPASASIHSNLLLSLHYADPYNAQTIFAEHTNWARRHGASPPKRSPSARIDRDPNRRLRIGYVSADLWSHSVTFFLEPLLAARDRNAFEVICYSNSLIADASTARLRGLADGWRYIGSLDDERACAIIQADAIDILVDLSGHTAGNRLPLFTHKPAPIQVTYLGYPDTTGIDAINYRLTDEWADPPGHTEEFHTEKLVHLPDGFLCYQPPRPCPQVSPPPMLRDGIVTFGSFNNLAKVSRTLVGHWAAILTAVPYSRLLLKSKGLSANGSREQMRQQFRDHGINAERIELVGWTSDRIDHMNLYRKVDIALDTFPYNGTTTTCEALWMGVPVMTLAGPVHVSRVGSSLLHAVGLTEMIAQSPSEYVRKAVALAGDTLRLASLRSTLRDRMQASPLTDAQRIAGAVEAAFRNMWQHIC